MGATAAAAECESQCDAAAAAALPPPPPPAAAPASPTPLHPACIPFVFPPLLFARVSKRRVQGHGHRARVMAQSLFASSCRRGDSVAVAPRRQRHSPASRPRRAFYHGLVAHPQRLWRNVDRPSARRAMAMPMPMPCRCRCQSQAGPWRFPRAGTGCEQRARACSLPAHTCRHTHTHTHGLYPRRLRPVLFSSTTHMPADSCHDAGPPALAARMPPPQTRTNMHKHTPAAWPSSNKSEGEGEGEGPQVSWHHGSPRRLERPESARTRFSLCTHARPPAKANNARRITSPAVDGDGTRQPRPRPRRLSTRSTVAVCGGCI